MIVPASELDSYIYKSPAGSRVLQIPIQIVRRLAI